MADRNGYDSYYPPPRYDSSYHHNRRGSSPGRPWNRDRLPPDRPPPPQRSLSSMDPRQAESNARGAAYPNKRGPSKSPDGAHARKLQKPNTQLENGSLPNTVDSRRSSISNGSTHGARSNLNINAQSALNQKPPPGAAVRKASDGALLSSPRSPLESATSGRSTPQQRTSHLSKDTTPQLPNGVPTATMNLNSMSLPDLLVKFSSDLANRAALEHGRNQAQSLLTGAQREYNEMKKHFKSYPAIEERKNMDKKAAAEALKSKEMQLLEHSASQQAIAEALAMMIGQLATPKPSPDTVSRSEYESLKLEMKQQAASMSQLRQDLTAAKQIADKARFESEQVPKFYSDIEQLKRDRSTLLNWKEDAEPRFTGLVNFGQRLAGVEAKSASTKNAFDVFMQERVDKLASKDDVNATYTSVVNNIRELQKFQAKTAAEKITSQSVAKEPAIDPWSNGRLQTLVDEQEKHAKEIKDLQLGGNQVFVDVQAKIDDTNAQQEAIAQTLEQLGTDLVACKEDVNVIRDSIEEEGKEIIVKRVKKLDVLVNNLSLKVGYSSDASTVNRVSQLEEDFKELQETARKSTTSYSAKSTPAMSVTAPTVDMKPFEARLDGLTTRLDKFIREEEEKDAMLEGHIKEIATTQMEAVSNKLNEEIKSVREGIEPAIAFAVKPLIESCHALQTAVTGLEEAMRSKVPAEAIESLKTMMATFSEEVKKLQATHQRMQSAQQSPRPGNHVLPPNGAFHGVQQSAQMPNGVVGSPQINRPQSPYTSQYPHGQQVQNVAPPQVILEMQAQINGLISVTQHLKMRCDNLQTDEVVKSMLDQFNAIYPDARTMNAAISNLRSSISSIQQSLAQQQQNKLPGGDRSVDDIKKAIARADGASKSAQVVSEDQQKIKTEINTIKEAVMSLEGTRPQESTSNDDSSVQDRVRSLRADLDTATATANDADRLSKQHASRFSKIQPEELKKRVAALEATVEQHTKDISTGEEAFKELHNAKASHQAEFDRVKKTAATNRQRIQDLEEKL